MITFTDSGAGLNSAQQNKLFQPFFTTKAIGKGTGMDLSVCEGIAELHQGSISLNPNFSQTQCVVILPKKQNLAKTA